MADKDSKTTFSTVMASIQAGRFAPVYILAGEEPYYIDRIADQLQKSVLAPDERDFNSHIYFGNDADIDVVINTARQYPVMAARKLVMLREAQTMQLAKTKLEKLTPYFQHPATATVLVITYKGEAPRSTAKWIKAAIDAGGVFFTSSPVRDYQLPAVIKDHCSSRRINIEPKAVQMLCDFIGTDLQRLFGEIDKLRLTAPDPQARTFSITADMVQTNIGISKDYNNYELTSALIARNYTKAMRIAEHYARNPKDNPPQVAASAIFNSFSRLMMAHYLPSRTDDAIRQSLGIWARPALEEVKRGIANYNAWSCLNIIHAIRDFDRRSKGHLSQQPSEQLFIELIHKIFTL